MRITETSLPDPRRQALLDAAAEVFFRDGFARARIDDIIAITGGSKRNIYQGFGGKNGLFEALIKDRTEAAIRAIETAKAEDGTLQQRLLHFGDQATNILFSPAMLGIFRAIMTGTPEMNQTPEKIIATTLHRITEHLAEILSRENENVAGQARPDVGRSADQLLSLLRGNLHVELLLGARDQVSDTERVAHVRAAISTFLYGYRGQKRHVD